MKPAIAYSGRLAIGALVSAALGCAALVIHAQLASRISGCLSHFAEVDADLSARITAGSEFENDRLETLRARVSRFRLQLGPSDTWERLANALGSDWTAEVGQREDASACSVQHGQFTMKSPALSDWPGIVERVRKVEALPGVAVAEFEMKTSGGRDRRAVDLVRILVSVQTRRTGSDPAGAR
jgi:hypothetical protein